jgi:hypothetical protein
MEATKPCQKAGQYGGETAIVKVLVAMSITLRIDLLKMGRFLQRMAGPEVGGEAGVVKGFQRQANWPY